MASKQGDHGRRLPKKHLPQLPGWSMEYNVPLRQFLLTALHYRPPNARPTAFVHQDFKSS
jgi:hypothetical protein